VGTDNPLRSHLVKEERETRAISPEPLKKIHMNKDNVPRLTKGAHLLTVGEEGSSQKEDHSCRKTTDPRNILRRTKSRYDGMLFKAPQESCGRNRRLHRATSQDV
jgi:hypothetical protein